MYTFIFFRFQQHQQVFKLVQTFFQQLCNNCTGSGETGSGETGSGGGTMKKCEICLADFSNEKDFEKHFEVHHDDRKGAFICQMCNESFSDKTDLEEHISKVHKENTPVEMTSKKERKKAEYDAWYMAEQKRQDEFYEKFETGSTDEIPDFDPDLLFNLERRKKRNICPHCKGNIDNGNIRSHLQNCAEAKVALEKRRQDIIDLGRGSSIGARVDVSVAQNMARFRCLSGFAVMAAIEFHL